MNKNILSNWIYDEKQYVYRINIFKRKETIFIKIKKWKEIKNKNIF